MSVNRDNGLVLFFILGERPFWSGFPCSGFLKDTGQWHLRNDYRADERLVSCVLSSPDLR